MRLQVRGVDHEPVGFAGSTRQLCEDAVAHAQAAPVDEAVVERLVRAVIFRSIASHQPELDDINDARDNTTFNDPRDAVRQRKNSSIRHVYAAECAKCSYYGQAHLDAAIESTRQALRTHSTGT